jgi:hypothetical protein
MPWILTSRFSNETMAENRAYAAKMKVKCIYSSPRPITEVVPTNAIMFMIEMNNSTNLVVAIGMVRNVGRCNAHVIYTNKQYNVFTYVGHTLILREEMIEPELTIMRALDILCMSGAYHQKRLIGISPFPEATLRRCLRDTNVDIAAEIASMFRRRSKPN